MQAVARGSSRVPAQSEGGSDVIRCQPHQGPVSDWDVGPRRQFVITLSGRAEIEVAGGQKVTIGPGHINLIEDTTGKGHITRPIGPDDRVVVTIPLADQGVGRAGR